MVEINLLPDYMKAGKNKSNKTKLCLVVIIINIALVFLVFFIPRFIVQKMEDKFNILNSQYESNNLSNNRIMNGKDIAMMKGFTNVVDDLRNERAIISSAMENLQNLVSKDVEILDLQCDGKSIVLNSKTSNFNSIIDFVTIIQKDLESDSVDLENISISQGQNNFLFRIKIDIKRGS
jgi:Tfp pilus assembly protein PilN